MSTFIQYTADGSNNLFNVPFPYISRTHVKVLVSGYVQVADGHYDWLNDSTIAFRPAYIPKAGAIVEIRRETPLDTQIVTFQSGAVLTEEELNLAVKQTLYLCQELRDKYDARLEAGLSRLSNGEAVTIDEMIAAITQEVLNSKLAADLQARITDIDLNAEAILEQHSRLNSLQATVDSLAHINGTDLTTFLENLQQRIIDGDTALAETIARIGAESPDGLSFIINTNTVKISPTETLGQRFSSLQSAIDTNEDKIADVQADLITEQITRANADEALSNNFMQLAARVDTNEDAIADVRADILAEQTARANADTALAETIALLGAKNAQGTAFILNTATTMVDASTSLGARLSGIQADIAENKAAILSEQTARAEADSALAADITTLQTTVNGHTASIQTHQTVIDGLAAQYMVKLDVNGYVSGFGLYNEGSSSQFIVRADKFAVVSPGSSPVVPFAVSGGVVYMQNVVIQDALINSLTVSKLSHGILNADMTVGTGKIIWDNGMYMKVAGVGFGSHNQFIEWFGPKMPISSCNEDDAIYYLKTNGDAYFGGLIHKGVLQNSATSTSLADNAEVTLGPFVTKGNPIRIRLSYSAEVTGFVTGDATSTQSISASVRLYQKIGTAAEVLVRTLNVDGTVVGLYDSWTNTTVFTGGMSGSLTYTDSVGGTANRQYRAVLVSRTLVQNAGYASQTINITSTEE